MSTTHSHLRTRVSRSTVDVLRAAVAGAVGTRNPGSTAPDRGDVEQIFLDWLADPTKPDSLRLDAADGPPTPLTELLGRLCTSPRRLPAAAATTLGLSPRARIGDAATQLLLAVKDPAGPRCRSYRAAAYYLRDLHELAAPFDEL